jgi:hypothetical protein
MILYCLNVDKIAKSLLKKFKTAEKEKKTMKTAFEDLDVTIDVKSRTKWEKQERMARDFRGNYLKIYEVRMDKGKSNSKI